MYTNLRTLFPFESSQIQKKNSSKTLISLLFYFLREKKSEGERRESSPARWVTLQENPKRRWDETICHPNSLAANTFLPSYPTFRGVFLNILAWPQLCSWQRRGKQVYTLAIRLTGPPKARKLKIIVLCGVGWEILRGQGGSGGWWKGRSWAWVKENTLKVDEGIGHSNYFVTIS